ncbi:MAG: hypothetical protein JNK85_10095 [Verrucomicrobiales bacterium]|nr:hypothetical protein [Verrucomicrobiales bacterium]
MRIGPTSVWATIAFLAFNFLGGPDSTSAHYPASPFVIDVTAPPYSAKGDGVTDDTTAIQTAINEHTGRHRVLYFPRGTYLVSRTLSWPKRWNGRDNWGKTMLRGEGRDVTILRLKDDTFTDTKKPAALMWCGGFGSADWFHNYVEHFTFDVGRGNPGAVALQFYSNNSGAVRDCRFVAEPGSGWIGLDLAHRDMNGPLLVQRCEVVGFKRGIATGHAVNSQTFEHLSLRGQTEAGFVNEGQSISIRALTSSNTVPALLTYGTLALIEGRLTGHGAASNVPAIVNYNRGRLMLRDIETAGYRRALTDAETPDLASLLKGTPADRPVVAGSVISEYFTHTPTTLFGTSATGSLQLPIQEPPVLPWDPPATWANVDQFGADSEGQRDSSEAVQRAIDSGATTVFLPGSYRLQTTVLIRGAVRRIIGLGGMISYGVEQPPNFRLVDGESPVVSMEHLAHVGGGLVLDSKRTLVLRSVSDCNLTNTARAEGGDVFLEDVVTHGLMLRRQRVWARQLNIENEGLHLRNDASELWILGYKTERGGTLLETRGGGRTEVLGNFSYTTTAGKLGPMFVNEDSEFFAYFTEICFNGDPFQTLVKESRGGEVRILRRGEGHTTPYLSRPKAR